MAASGSATQGDIQNKQQLTDIVISGVNATVALADGIFVYINGASGLTIVPVTDAVVANRVRFLAVGVDNSAASVITDKEAETFKHNAIVVCQCDGVLVVGGAIRASTDNAGRAEALADIATGDSAETIATFLRHKIGNYLGLPGEAQETGNEPSDSSDNDLVVVHLD